MSENTKVTMQVKANGSIRVTGMLIFLMQMEMSLRARMDFYFVVVVTQQINRFAMALTKPLALKHHHYLNY